MFPRESFPPAGQQSDLAHQTDLAHQITDLCEMVGRLAQLRYIIQIYQTV